MAMAGNYTFPGLVARIRPGGNQNGTPRPQGLYLPFLKGTMAGSCTFPRLLARIRARRVPKRTS